MTIYTLSKQLNIASQNEVRKSHHPKAKELMAFLKDIDFHDFNDYFCWKTGGDGDNGEVLLEQLDTFFATKDHENNNVRPALERIAETFDKITDDYKTLK